MTDQASLIREKLVLPNGAQKLLLHSCCAPCSGEVMEALLASEIDFTIFFYNPNIHPIQEYELRKNENIVFAEKHDIPFIDADYDKDQWFARIKGLEWEPERGKRCTACFDMRFERTALYAYEHGFSVISSSLGISRWKDMQQINTSGERAAGRYPEMVYWTYNWRQKGGSERMYQIAKREQFYKQEYCGCVYSLRDTNKWRKEKGRDRIKMGEVYYGFPEIPIRCSDKAFSMPLGLTAESRYFAAPRDPMVKPREVESLALWASPSGDEGESC